MDHFELPTPELHNGSIHVRPWREDDLDDVHRATQDPLIPHFTRVPANQSLDDVRRFFAGHEQARATGTELALAIVDAAADRFLGAISLLRVDWSERRCEIGYWLAPWGRGRGAASGAVRLLARWALASGVVARIALHTDVDNEASQRVATRCGFTREGVLRSFEQRDGRRYDIVIYSLVVGDSSATEH